MRPVDWLDYERVQLRRKTDGKVLDELDFAVADLLSTSVAPPVATTNNVAPSTADKLGAAATNDGESPNLAGLNDVASPIIVDFTPAYDVEIWVELPEMGVLGWATLTDVDENVAIQPGPGAVVTGTFAHVSDAVIDLQIEDQPKPIGCTTTHPFWSVDRQDFVEAGRLQQGERVQLYNGETKRVVQKLPRPGPVNVYNLEVYAEHVYRVTPDGVLVHNNCPGRIKPNQGAGAPHGKSAHNQLIDFIIVVLHELAKKELIEKNSIRKNQVQVIDGVRVGSNRPDIQFKWKDGPRIAIEIDRNQRKNDNHWKKIYKNDRNIIFVGIIIDDNKGALITKIKWRTQ